jgi:N-acetylmuramoyl-L-alanine amidase
MHVVRSPNFDSRRQQPVDMLVIHYTGMATAAAALARLVDPAAAVSAHYLIDDDGRITALVDEADRAWHAGRSFWRGWTDINARSIGIELANPGHAFGYRPFPEPQMAALIELARAVVARHAIPARNVVGHADIAPRRKQDPGELFDWRRLARHGLGRWPAAAVPAGADAAALAAALTRIGYETEDLRATLVAFQRHYRPGCCDGRPDAETAALILALDAGLAGSGA